MTAPVACKDCPWRLSNQGKRHPDGWYTKRNLTRLWALLRTGETMSCHPTDPGNPVSEAAQAAGYRPAPSYSKPRECTGALVLVQREVMVMQDHGSVAEYRRARPRGLRTSAFGWIVERLIFGGVVAPAMAKPDLNDPDVGAPWLPWERRS